MILQLSYGGATGLQAVAPSPIACKFVQREPRELTHDEVVEIEDKFAAAAVRAKMAGFDGVEIHGAHGYLINEFLSPYTNHRTDEYGGSAENRRRFPTNIIRKARELVGPDFIIGYRISGSEGVEGGVTPDYAGEFIQSVEDMLDYVNVAAGIYETMAQYIIPPVYEPHAMVVPFAEVIKKYVTKIPVIVVNSLSPEAGEKVLEEGKADIIAFGRSLIADPYLPQKLAEGRREDIRPCCRGHEGCVSLFFAGCPIRCEVNPQCGREKEYAPQRTNDPRNIVVVGGGVAGMETARYAAEVGHRVTLFEETAELGGHFIEATVPEFKEDHRNVLEWLITQVKKKDIDIRLSTKATRENVAALHPDLVVVATGSKYIQIPIPGIEKAVMPDDALKGNVELGNNVAVIGGGLVGSETALHLAQQGKNVTIIEMLNGIALQDEPLSQISILDKLAKNNVKQLLECKVSAIEDGSVTYTDKDGNEHKLAVDNVVAATGLAANEEASKVFEGIAPKVKCIGDAVRGRKIFDCFHEAWFTVRNI